MMRYTAYLTLVAGRVQVGGVGRGGDEGTDWALGAAEGLLGLSWMGCDVHKSKDLNSTLNSVQKALRSHSP